MDKAVYKKNVPNWQATSKDYRLIFRECDGEWREVTNNLPKYFGMTLADYLQVVGVILDDDCVFCRIRRGDWMFEFRACSGYVRIDVAQL